MPASAIDGPGTSESAWAAWPGLAALPELDLSAWDSAVVVAAHPDDEVLGAGGIIARLAAGFAACLAPWEHDGHSDHEAAGRAARRACGTAAAVAEAARRNVHRLNVCVERRSLPGEWPPGSYDLIVVSELLYYFGDADLADVLRRAAGALRPGGTLLAVHWRHPVPEYPRTGDQAHAALRCRPGLARLAAYADADFLAEAFTAGAGPATSVAAAGGLA